ncbi:MAG: hypothetical protein A2X84_13055 [Desulfuromonadaceae bacterium GWC2_58_13]|nr:MAG: hypothetical protein A2X84_13055 [Desulfuromonadaceae bacterium GWC2_58_13]
MHEESGQPSEKKSNIQNLWDTTLKTVQDAIKNAIQPATRYVLATQKKIELFLLTRKLSAAQNDFGKLVDKARESGLANVFENSEVKSALDNLDQLKQTASKLTQEIDELQKPIAPVEDAPKE